MPRIKVVGHGYVNLPDGMSEAEMAEAIHKLPDVGGGGNDSVAAAAGVPANSGPGENVQPSASGFLSNAVDSAGNAALGVFKGISGIMGGIGEPWKIPGKLKGVAEGIGSRVKEYADDIHPIDAAHKLAGGDILGALGTALPVGVAYKDPVGVGLDALTLSEGVNLARGAASIPRRMRTAAAREALDFPTKGVEPSNVALGTGDPEAWRSEAIKGGQPVATNAAGEIVGTPPNLDDTLAGMMEEHQAPSAGDATTTEPATTTTGKADKMADSAQGTDSLDELMNALHPDEEVPHPNPEGQGTMDDIDKAGNAAMEGLDIDQDGRSMNPDVEYTEQGDLSRKPTGNAYDDADLLDGLPKIYNDESLPMEARADAWSKMGEVVGEEGRGVEAFKKWLDYGGDGMTPEAYDAYKAELDQTPVGGNVDDLNKMMGDEGGTGESTEEPAPAPDSYQETLRQSADDPGFEDKNYHTGAEPGSADADSARAHHKAAGEMDADYRRRIDDEKGMVTPDLLLHALSGYLAHDALRHGMGAVKNSLHNPVPTFGPALKATGRGALDLGLLDRLNKGDQ